MRIARLDVIPLGLDFEMTFRFGSIDRSSSTNIIVRIETEDGLVGFGEACPVSAFTAETWESITASIEGRLRPLVVGRSPLDITVIIRDLENVLTNSPFTLTAIDIALWDLAGRALGVSVLELLGGGFRSSVTQHGSVGLASAQAMAEVGQKQVKDGFGTLKLYAGRDESAADLDRIAAVRGAVGPGVPFILDVNGRWDTSTCLAMLPELVRLGVIALEQPVAAWDTLGQVEVATRSPIPIVADESVYTASDAADIARQRRARIINLGLSKLGGLTRARNVATVARATGLQVTVGSVLEAGIATAAGLHLAASLPELSLPCYLIGPMKYRHQITVPALEIHGGVTEVPTGPGLGVTVDPDLLAAADLRRGNHT